MLRIVCAAAVVLGLAAPLLAADETDPYLWLEDVQGEKALAWVKAQNSFSTQELEAVPEYQSILKRCLEIYDSDERIPTPSQEGAWLYNFWQDPAHERGILRRTTLASYRTADPAWETVLDIDALSKADGQPWVYKGRTSLPPENRHAMVALSAGGSDAVIMREFDSVTKTFVPDGFTLPAAKSQLLWKDANTLWVATDFGAGSLTTSGYPRIVKEWKRGTPLADARVIFTGRPDDVSVDLATYETAGGNYNVVSRSPAFFQAEILLGVGDGLVRLPLPLDAEFQAIFQGRALFSLRTDWTVGGTTHPQGALLAIDLNDLLQGRTGFTTLFEPSERVSLGSVATTRDRVLITTLDNVRSRLWRLAPDGDRWTRDEIALPGLGTVDFASTAADAADFFITYEDFLTPVSLYLVAGGRTEKLKSMPAFFDATGMNVVQQEATSRDGTKIPYFLVTPAGYRVDGVRPTLLYGYGGFEIAQRPAYSAITGANWLARGGVYALANIRGGGEFGPRWHQAAQKENRIKSFEDFIAVAEDLIARGITSPAHLGIMGGSQGGLLVGGAFTLRPDLFGAVVCQVPLLDMQRFNKLLAGASWMAEYGNPDVPEDWAYIRTWSPYQLLKPDVKYPKVFFWTTTRDDRVHPGHARKMVARMLGMGQPVYYYENIEGGHGLGSTNRQRAQIRALEFSYLWKMIR
ncbi:MAG: prolyl oligopeptidase family serine peptidase [Candidatus Krumholzibacteriia bacterium]